MPVRPRRARRRDPADRARRFGNAWFLLGLALGAHVMDEALTDFLGVWNPLVETLRSRVAWVPLPTFSFPVWLTGLIIAVLVLLWLSRFAFRARPWMIPLAFLFGAVMIGNGVLHIAGSVWSGTPMPGVVTAPFLIVLGGNLLARAAAFRTGP